MLVVDALLERNRAARRGAISRAIELINATAARRRARYPVGQSANTEPRRGGHQGTIR